MGDEMNFAEFLKYLLSLIIACDTSTEAMLPECIYRHFSCTLTMEDGTELRAEVGRYNHDDALWLLFHHATHAKIKTTIAKQEDIRVFKKEDGRWILEN